MKRRIVLLACASILFSGIAGQGNVFAKVKSYTIKKSGRTISLKTGDQAKLSFAGVKKLHIKVSSKRVATARKKGKKVVVTAVKAGNTKLTVKGNQKKYVVKIKVTPGQEDSPGSTAGSAALPSATGSLPSVSASVAPAPTGAVPSAPASVVPVATGAVPSAPASVVPVATGSEPAASASVAPAGSELPAPASAEPVSSETGTVSPPASEAPAFVPSASVAPDIVSSESPEESILPSVSAGSSAPAVSEKPGSSVSPSPAAQAGQEYDAGTVDENDYARYFSPYAVHHSTATYYDNGYTNTCCNLDDIAGNYDVCAINEYDYNTGLMAGAYLEVTGPLGKVNVLVTDLMPYQGNESNCYKGALDLNENTFAKIANKVDGKVDISWKVIPFPADGPIQYKFKDTSSQWWAEIQVRNMTYPVKKLEVKKSDGSYMELPRKEYNYFEAASGLGSDTVTFRVTDIFDRVREDTVTVQGGAIQNGSGNFPEL